MGKRLVGSLFILAGVIVLMSVFSPKAKACGDPGESYLGSVCWVAGNYCPKGYAEIDNHAEPIIENIKGNEGLFSLFGTTFGGDGRVTFGLPNLTGREIVGTGTASGLSSFSLGETVGKRSQTLTVENLPPHSHEGIFVIAEDVSGSIKASSTSAPNLASPKDAYPAAPANGLKMFSADADTTMDANVLDTAAKVQFKTAVTGMLEPKYFFVGGVQMGMRACVQVQGDYPPRP